MQTRGFVVTAAFTYLTLFPALVHAGDAARAKRDLFFAKDAAESGKWDDLDSFMKKAAVDMDGLSDAEKVPLSGSIGEIHSIVTKSVEEDVTKRLDKAAKADSPGSAKIDTDRAAKLLDSDEAKNYADPAVIAKLRARLAAAAGGGAPVQDVAPSKPVMTGTDSNKPVSYELGTAKSRARLAHTMLEQGDPRAAETAMHDTLRLLKDVPESARGPVLQDMTELSAQIDEADLKAQRAEEFRRIDEQVHRFVYSADSSIQEGRVCSPEWIDKSQSLLNGSAATTYMNAEQIGKYQTQIDALRVKLKAHNQAVALQRAEPIVKELEGEVAADPFKGVQEGSAYIVYDKLKTLSDRAHAELRAVPNDDPKIATMSGRVDAANSKMEAAVGKWAMAKTEEKFSASWKFASGDFSGWEAEKLTTSSPRHIEGLDKTIQAVSGTVYWLNDHDTRATADKYKADAVIVAVVASAQKTLDEASAKLNDAFGVVLADAEKQPMPQREADRNEVGLLARDAGSWLAGTKYMNANVGRAQALDAKWKADVARAEKEMAEELKTLTAAANAKWPGIEVSVGADRGFNAKDAQLYQGKTIEIKGYYNRSGWDFDSAYDYAVDIKGVPVAGKYDDNVRAAFAEGSRHTKFGIDDHVGWDLIAVVQGSGQINRRVTTEWRDKDTHELIRKTESLRPESCVVLKIVGLRAGPVAVGPK